jgi:hypothetical protein
MPRILEPNNVQFSHFSSSACSFQSVILGNLNDFSWEWLRFEAIIKRQRIKLILTNLVPAYVLIKGYQT